MIGGPYSIDWFENDGNSDPNFSKNNIVTGTPDVYDLDAADMDNDGDLDFLAALHYYDVISIFRNDGESDPTFLEGWIYTYDEEVWSVHSADVDGDGDLDMLTGLWENTKIIWYEFDETGDPDAIHNVALGINYPVSVYSGDMDGDGDVDIVSGSFYNEKIYWYENKSIYERRVYIPLIIR